MTSSGYIFKGVYVEPEQPAKVAKIPISEQRKELILSITEPPHITVDRVMEEVGVAYQTAANLLRELTFERKLKKYGRGASAIWKNVEIKQIEIEELCEREES
jgi:DeoR/GlpR family transcriptional regulator of sugar metabolism